MTAEAPRAHPRKPRPPASSTLFYHSAAGARLPGPEGPERKGKVLRPAVLAQIVEGVDRGDARARPRCRHINLQQPAVSASPTATNKPRNAIEQVTAMKAARAVWTLVAKMK